MPMPSALAPLIAVALVSATAGVADSKERPASARIRIAPAGERGDKLVMTGRITDPTGRPIPGATLHVYHADANGVYAKPGARAPRLSGTVQVGADGAYRIETVVPSQIRNLEGGHPHIHGSATAPGHTRADFVVNLTLAGGRHLDATRRAEAGARSSMDRMIYRDALGTWWLIYDPRLP